MSDSNSVIASSGSKEKNQIEVVETIHAPADLIDYTPEEERAVVKKIDTYVLPIMCLVFFCQYLDKQTLSYTVVFGLKTDLKLDGNQYSWLSSGFYIAQMASQLWNGYALSKFPIKVVTGVSVLLWGASCMCLAAPNNFSGFMAVRALLGFFEGAVSPSFVIVTSMYYKKSEHALRTACWISSNALAQVIGTYIVYGVGKNSSLTLSVWKVTFLICGAMTVFVGGVFYFGVPLSPGEAWFLNEREREIAVHRTLAESDRGERSSFDKKQLWECLNFDWITYSSFLFGFLNTVTSGPITFSSLMISNLGYKSFDVLKYGSPSGAVQFMFIWIGVLMTILLPKQRVIVVQLLILIPVVGNILLLALPQTNSWGIIVASWLGSSITCFYSIMLSLNASNTRGNTKKSIVNNAYYLGYALAAVVYPQWWNYSKDPTYRTGLITNLVFWGVLEVLMVAYRWKCISENKRRQALEDAGQLPDYDEKVDLTDKQDLYHRYSY